MVNPYKWNAPAPAPFLSESLSQILTSQDVGAGGDRLLLGRIIVSLNCSKNFWNAWQNIYQQNVPLVFCTWCNYGCTQYIPSLWTKEVWQQQSSLHKIICIHIHSNEDEEAQQEKCSFYLTVWQFWEQNRQLIPTGIMVVRQWDYCQVLAPNP